MRPALVGPVDIRALQQWVDVDGPEPLPAGPPRGTTPTTQLARALLAGGQDLVVVTLSPSVTEPRRFSGDGLVLEVGPYRERHRTRDGLRVERRAVSTALQRHRVDIAHAQWLYEYALGARASGRRTLVTVRDWPPTIFRLQPRPYWAVRMSMGMVALARCRHFTVTSPYMLRKVTRWSRGTVELIPNAIGDDAFTDDVPSRRDTRRLLAVNNGFSVRKNVTTLLRALPSIRRRVPGATLTLVGYDYQPDGPAAVWAAEHGLATGVQFAGELGNDAVHDLMRTSGVFVHPALEESFGLVLVEAMAHRLPVIGGRGSGAVPWVLDHGRAGTLTDVTDPSVLADAVVTVLTQSSRTERTTAAGFARAFAHFRTGVVTERYLDLYTRVAD